MTESGMVERTNDVTTTMGTVATAGTHDGKRKKKRKVQARLAERDTQTTLQSAAIMRANRAKEKEAFRARMERRRHERVMMEEADNQSSEDDGAGLRYAMSLPKEMRRA